MRVASLLLTVLVLAVSLIDGPYPREQWLQHSATALLLLGLAIDVKTRWLSPRGFACVVAFVWLHIIGARWVYSMVPYDAWLEAVGLPSTRELLGWRRNHYDRLVHFSFGVFAMKPLADLTSRVWPAAVAAPDKSPPRLLGVPQAVLVALLAVTAFGAVYEIFEWLLAVVMSPEAAERYNGQQGDFFDAQKDLALALVGSLIVAPLTMRSVKPRPASQDAAANA